MQICENVWTLSISMEKASAIYHENAFNSNIFPPTPQPVYQFGSCTSIQPRVSEALFHKFSVPETGLEAHTHGGWVIYCLMLVSNLGKRRAIDDSGGEQKSTRHVNRFMFFSAVVSTKLIVPTFIHGTCWSNPFNTFISCTRKNHSLSFVYNSRINFIFFNWERDSFTTCIH